jgi:hypothetical protein
MPTYPVSPQLTVDALLRQPEIIARALTNLAYSRYVADRIFSRGSAEQVAGGVVRYQRSESIFTERDPEEVAPRAAFPRTSWSETVLTDIVHQYGLEVPIHALTIRRHAMDQVQRAMVKLANSLVKYVDTKAMTLLTSDANVQTFSASGDWTTAATDIILDITEAVRLLAAQNEGYENAPLTMVVNWAQWKDVMTDKDIRDALPREGSNLVVRSSATEIPFPIAGISRMIATPNLTAGTVLIVADQLAGSIADEVPDAREGYASYSPGEGQAPIFVKVYEDQVPQDFIVRAARWPAMWLAEPKAAVKITGA